MAEIICNTSPLQYLHQLGQLELLHQLASRITVPTAVVEELSAGRSRGFNVPDPETLDWVSIRQPKGAEILPLVIDLGAGETAVLALALESENAQVVLDDGLARRMAETLNIRLKGTLGILLDAKRAGLIIQPSDPFWINCKHCVFVLVRLLARQFSNKRESYTNLSEPAWCVEHTLPENINHA